jgi:predicted GNAT family acetyltransferase
MDEHRIRALYAHVDALDAAAFAAAFTDEGSAAFGNSPPARGRAAIETALRGFFALLDGMKHDFIALWPVPEGWVLEATVAYSVKGVAAPVRVTGTTILRTDGERLRDVRIYYDLAPVMAAAQASRVPETAQPAAPPIEHLREHDGHKGAFVLAQDGERLAEMTYTTAGAELVIVDHTWVADALRGTGTGRRLLDALVAWVREGKAHVIPICPYARAQFDKDPSIRDVLSP